MKLSSRTDRPETLVVEIIRHPIDLDLFQNRPGPTYLGRGQPAQVQAKTIGLDVGRGVRLRYLAQVVHSHVLMVQPAPWAVEQGEILDGPGMSVLESAIGKAARRYLPAPANCSQGIGGRPAALLQPVETIRSLSARNDFGQLLDLEVLGLLLYFHCRQFTQYHGKPEWCVEIRITARTNHEIHEIHEKGKKHKKEKQEDENQESQLHSRKGWEEVRL